MKNYAMRRHARSLTLHVQMKAINRIRRVCVVDDGSQYVSAIFPKPDATWKRIPERLPAISWLCHQSTDPAAVSYLLRAAWHHSSRGRKEIEYHLAVFDKFDSHVRICCTQKKGCRDAVRTLSAIPLFANDDNNNNNNYYCKNEF